MAHWQAHTFVTGEPTSLGAVEPLPPELSPEQAAFLALAGMAPQAMPRRSHSGEGSRHGLRPGRHRAADGATGPAQHPIATTLTGHAAVQPPWTSCRPGALTVEAAMRGDRRLALQTFLQDPAVAAVLAPEDAARPLDDLLGAHARHLPRFN